MLNDFSTRQRTTRVKDATAMRHSILVGIFNCAVVVKRINHTQVQQHPIQHLDHKDTQVINRCNKTHDNLSVG